VCVCIIHVRATVCTVETVCFVCIIHIIPLYVSVCLQYGILFCACINRLVNAVNVLKYENEDICSKCTYLCLFFFFVYNKKIAFYVFSQRGLSKGLCFFVPHIFILFSYMYKHRDTSIYCNL
jgi:hypothetical protein